MTSLSTIFRTALTGLHASQTGLQVAAQNVANVNTPGYVRTEVQFTPLTQFGNGAGVDDGVVQRAANRFLATASHMAEAAQGRAGARSELLARAQASFGDPSSETSLFATFERVWPAFTSLGVDPSSTLRRDEAVASLSALYSEVRRTAQDVQVLIGEADERVGDKVSEAQDIIQRIAALNNDIRLTRRSGADAAAAENAQSAAIDKLAAILDIRVTPLEQGGVHVRTGGGALLVGESAANIAYTPSGAPFSAFNGISYNAAIDNAGNLEPYLGNGELKGLIEARDVDLRQLAEALGGFAAAIGDALNKVHNENSSYPAPSDLQGRQTGLLAGDALNFTGKAIIGVTDANGALAQRLTIDFDAGQISAEQPAGAFNFSNTIGSFASALNLALAAASPAGAASFTDGRLSLTAASGAGLIVQQDGADPSARTGRGFAHFFGLNDVVDRPAPIFFETGGAASDAHGLNSGGVLNFRVRDTAGRIISSPSLTINGALAAGGSTWTDLVATLNNTSTGLGQYAVFSYDAAAGRVDWTPRTGFDVVLNGDSTTRGATGVSMSSLFGLSYSAGATRAVEMDVSASIAANPGRLGVARPDLSAAIGDVISEAGDNRGAAALARARDAAHDFPAAGQMLAQSTSPGIYAARFAGMAGRISSDAARATEGARALATAAGDRRSQVEGVSIDDELIRMTTYQNAYAAASRLIQAANEMYDILLALGRY